jgi:WD40 repeat protein
LLFGAVFATVLAFPTAIRAADAPRTDAHGDPLPDGALARLGTVRWRAGNNIVLTSFLGEGRSLLTVTQDGIVQVWDRDSGKELSSFDAVGVAPAAAPAAARVLMLSATNTATLSGDGKLLACPGRDGSVHLWDPATGKAVGKVGDLRTFARGQVALTADGKTLAAAVYGQPTTLWDTATGKEVRSFGEATVNSRLMAYRMAFAPDGKVLVQSGLEVGNGGIKTAVVVWDAINGKELRRFVEASAGGSLPAMLSAIAPDAKLAALPSGNKVKLIDLATGKEARELDGYEEQAALVFSRDSKQLVAMAGRNEALTVWDVATGQRLRQLGKGPVAAAPGAPAVRAANRGMIGVVPSLSPDGKLLAWGDGPAARLVSLQTGKETNADAGHAGAPTDVLFTRDGKSLLTSGDDATVRRWDAANGKEIGQVTLPGKSYAFVALSPDERVVAAGDTTGTVHLIDAATGAEKHSLPPPLQAFGRAVTFSPDGRWLAAVSPLSPAVEVYDVAGGKVKHALQLPAAQAAAPGGVIVFGARGTRRAFFSPDGRYVAATDGDIVLWDALTGREERQLTVPQGVQVRSAVFSPDGRLIAAETTTGEINVWEVASGQKRLTINAPAHPGPTKPRAAIAVISNAGGMASPVTLAFSPNGRLLAQTDNRKARLWDVYTGQEVGGFEGHRGPLTGMAFSPDGRRLATVSGDTTGLLWDAEPVAKKLAPLATAALAKEKLPALWEVLGEADGGKAFEAIRALAGDPAKAVPFLAERVKPVTPPDGKQIARMISDLDAEQFDVRDAAHKGLETLGELALAPLRAALKGKPSAEQRRSLEELVKAAASTSSTGERLRLVRAIEALEMIATPEAIRILKEVAAGAPDTLPTNQAQAVLARLGRN